LSAELLTPRRGLWFTAGVSILPGNWRRGVVAAALMAAHDVLNVRCELVVQQP